MVCSASTVYFLQPSQVISPLSAQQELSRLRLRMHTIVTLHGVVTYYHPLKQLCPRSRALQLLDRSFPKLLIAWFYGGFKGQNTNLDQLLNLLLIKIVIWNVYIIGRSLRSNKTRCLSALSRNPSLDLVFYLRTSRWPVWHICASGYRSHW